MTSIRREVLAVGMAMAALAMGCQTADEGDLFELAQTATAEPGIDAGIAGSERDAQTPELDAGPEVMRPLNAPYSVEIAGNGTGCPDGSWTSTLAADGETFEVAFSRFEAAAADGQRSAFKDCHLTVKLRGPSGFSYAVTDFQYQGRADLEPNVRAAVTAKHYTAGNPVPSERELRTDLTGPVERAYAFAKATAPMDMIWSPCGRDRYLNIPTRVFVQKSQTSGAGSITLSAIQFKLASRTCN
jgi:hypothetical protein